MGDGQVLMGTVTTEAVQLETGLGTLAVPLDDIGEIVPVEASDVGTAKGQVEVFLRNGSGFRGEWSAPELAMGVTAGGEVVPVDVPTARLTRLQFTGSEAWNTDVTRMHTRYGDDFLVDAKESRLTVQSSLGTFRPTIAECVTMRPIGEPTGPWHIELTSGTILEGPLAEDHLVVALPMGPGTVDVKLADIVWIAKEQWTAPPPAAVAAEQGPAASPAATAPPRWFSSTQLRDQKAQYTH
jgi:hypothetical protein